MGNIIKMKWKMIEVLTNPNKFFETRIKGEESLMIPVLIVLINGIISGGTVAFLIVSVSQQILPPEVHPEVHSLALKFGINSFIFMTFFAFVAWLVVAAVFFGISWIYEGKGGFMRTLEFVGYGFIPSILGGLISAVLVYNFVSTMHIPQIIDPMMAEATIRQIEQIAKQSPIMRLSSIVGILFTLWSGIIWVFGLKHARNLSTKNALITVAIPVMVHILYSIYQMGVFK